MSDEDDGVLGDAFDPIVPKKKPNPDLDGELEGEDYLGDGEEDEVTDEAEDEEV